jgi:hypothetical protein
MARPLLVQPVSGFHSPDLLWPATVRSVDNARSGVALIVRSDHGFHRFSPGERRPETLESIDVRRQQG